MMLTDRDFDKRQALNALVVEGRSGRRKQLVAWLQHVPNMRVEGLSPGRSLSRLEQGGFDVVLLGKVGHRHLQKQLERRAHDGNPKVALDMVDDQTTRSDLRERVVALHQQADRAD